MTMKQNPDYTCNFCKSVSEGEDTIYGYRWDVKEKELQPCTQVDQSTHHLCRRCLIALVKLEVPAQFINCTSIDNRKEIPED